MVERTLLDWLQQQPLGTLTPPEVAQLIQQAAGALQHIHDQGEVYGHITPASFLILPGSERAHLPSLQLANVSMQSSALTPASMAPEQWYGTILPATDQYALAIMAYQILTWRSPFQENRDQLMYQHLNVQPEPPRRFNPRVSPDLERVIMRARAKQPGERYAS